MSTTETRVDLLRGLLQACYVIEHARAGLQRKWSGEFDRDAERTGMRAEQLARLLEERGFHLPNEVIGPHTDWFESLCGSHSSEVPLGAAVLHNFGKWADIFCESYLDDIEEFRELGRGHTRVAGELTLMSEEDAFLPKLDLPEGRRFVILTDVHIGSGRDDLAQRAVTDINSIEPEFVVIPGDITEDGEPEQFGQAKEIFEGFDCPWYVVPGNHDAVQRSTRLPIGSKLFKEVFGEEPDDHVVDCGDLQVALVDTTDPTASPFPDWDIASGRVGGDSAGIDSGALR
ncbi:MAG: metallophosphoesterase family protein, partial [Acidimicrobiia bacterium]